MRPWSGFAKGGFFLFLIGAKNGANEWPARVAQELGPADGMVLFGPAHLLALGRVVSHNNYLGTLPARVRRGMVVLMGFDFKGSPQQLRFCKLYGTPRRGTLRVIKKW